MPWASRPLVDWGHRKLAERGGSLMALSALSAYIRGSGENQKPNKYPVGRTHTPAYIFLNYLRQRLYSYPYNLPIPGW
jgi:hypothetical protein